MTSLPHRARFVYDDGDPVDYRTALPARPWVASSVGVGGSDVSGAGIPAAFLIRRDRMAHLTLRFFEHEWPNVERLVAHLQAAGSVTYYADASVIGESVYGHSPAMGEEVMPRRVDAGILEIDLVLRRTGDPFAQTYFDGVLFRFRPQAAGFFDFTRAGSVGKYTDEFGVLQDAAANIPRTDWLYLNGGALPDTPSLLIEAARTNLVTDDDLSDSTPWLQTGPPTVTGSVSDPAGGTGAYTVEDDAGGSAEYISHTVALTGPDASVVFVIRDNTFPSSSTQIIGLYDDTAGPIRVGGLIDGWDDDTGPSFTNFTGTHLGNRYVGNGYWAVYMSVAGTIDSGHTNRVRIIPGNAGATGSMDVYRVNVYDEALPLWSIVDASETKAAETWYAPLTPVPKQAMTIYVKFVETGIITLDGSGASIVGIGGSSNYIRIYKSPSVNRYGIAHDFSGVGVGAFPSITDPTFGQVVEFRGVINADGSIDSGISVDGGTEATASNASTATLPASFGSALLRLASNTSSADQPTVILAVKVVAGVRTMDEMRGL